eukprot:3711721-Pyramimonas_sp.AAC.1
MLTQKCQTLRVRASVHERAFCLEPEILATEHRYKSVDHNVTPNVSMDAHVGKMSLQKKVEGEFEEDV